MNSFKRGHYAEAVQSGKEVLSIKPNDQDGMFMTFLGGKSAAYLEFVDNELKTVKQLEAKGLATNTQFMRLVQLLNKLVKKSLMLKPKLLDRTKRKRGQDKTARTNLTSIHLTQRRLVQTSTDTLLTSQSANQNVLS